VRRVVGRDKLINAIRSKKFSFKRETERIHLYKQKGSTKRVQIRSSGDIDPKNAAFVLKSAGFTEDEVKKFLAECDQLH
jgi:hypothetical protein